ncbi:IPT/TIG domain-containing protein [Actinopolymorpha sp. B17G11]|uniref:IPT/TIG domain-containing protein n=1 Tax=Actinopolymorpha sp. B17G11 TaxID=3160861 RepID=UPI0032E4612C
MGWYDASGNRIAKGSFPTEAADDPFLRVTSDVYEKHPYPHEDATNTGNEGSMLRLAYKAGTVIRQSDLDRMYPSAAVLAVSPATGPAAGGTVVTVTGQNLDGVTGVTFGGDAGTSLQVLSGTQVRVTTPAHAAGAVNVVATDDSGSASKTNAFTYA